MSKMQSSVGRSALLVHSSLQQGQLEEVAYSPLGAGMTALFLRRMRLGEGPLRAASPGNKLGRSDIAG